MAKPIFIIGIPNSTKYDIDRIKKFIGKEMSDYYVLVYSVNSKFNYSFQVFYEKDFNQVKFEELKRIIKDKIR